MPYYNPIYSCLTGSEYVVLHNLNECIISSSGFIYQLTCYILSVYKLLWFTQMVFL